MKYLLGSFGKNPVIYQMSQKKMELTHLHKRKFGSFQIPYQNSIFCESLCNFLLLWPSYRDLLLLLPRLEGELSQLWEMFEMKQCCSTKERKNKLLMFCFHCMQYVFASVLFTHFLTCVYICIQYNRNLPLMNMQYLYWNMRKKIFSLIICILDTITREPKNIGLIHVYQLIIRFW